MKRRGWILWEMTIVLLIIGSLAMTSIRLLHSTTLQTSRLLSTEREADALERCLRLLRRDVLSAAELHVVGGDRLRISSDDGEIEWTFRSDGSIERQIFLLAESRSQFAGTQPWEVVAVAGGIELRRGERTVAIPSSVVTEREATP